MNIKLSFIIPIYNIDRYLVIRCIESILKQSYSNKEIIVINDGSTKNIGEEYLIKRAKNEEIIYVKQDNKGVSVARNIGLSKSNGDFIVFVDPDDYLDANFCLNIHNKLINTNADLIFLKYTSRKENLGKKDGNNILINKYFYKKVQLAIIEQSEIYKDISLGSPWAKVYRRNFLIDNELMFRPNLKKSQDRLFMLNVLEKKPNVDFFNYCGYFYYINPNSICNKYNEDMHNILSFYLECIDNFINSYHINEKEYLESYYHLKVKVFLQILRLEIYNDQNNNLNQIKLEKMISIFNEGYKESFNKVKLSKLGCRRKLIVVLMNIKFYRLIRFII